MTTQQTLETLFQNEGKLNQYASLSGISSHPKERMGIIETLIAGSAEDRELVVTLLRAFETSPECYRPIVQHFEELKTQMLRREDGWKKIAYQFKNSHLPNEASMTTVAWLCDLVDRPLQSIVHTLQGLAAASAIESFLQWAAEESYDKVSA